MVNPSTDDYHGHSFDKHYSFSLDRQSLWSLLWHTVTMVIPLTNNYYGHPLKRLSGWSLSPPHPHLTYPLTTRVVGAPQIISQTDFFFLSLSMFLFSTALWDLAIPWCCLPKSFSVCLQDGFGLTWWTGDMFSSIAVWTSLRWPGGLRVFRLTAGSWHWLPRW